MLCLPDLKVFSLCFILFLFSFLMFSLTILQHIHTESVHIPYYLFFFPERIIFPWRKSEDCSLMQDMKS